MPRPSPRGFTSRDCDAFEEVQIAIDYERLVAETNKHGSFTTTLTIPPGSVGSHTIRATGAGATRTAASCSRTPADDPRGDVRCLRQDDGWLGCTCCGWVARIVLAATRLWG